MNKILGKYTKLRIAEICGVQPKTVYNWFEKKNMPYWAFRKLGYEPLSMDDIQKLFKEGYQIGITGKPFIKKFEEIFGGDENE